MLTTSILLLAQLARRSHCLSSARSAVRLSPPLPRQLGSPLLTTTALRSMQQQTSSTGGSVPPFRPPGVRPVEDPHQQQQLAAAAVMQNVLRRVRDVNHMPVDIKASLLDFCVDGIKLGQVRPNMAKLLCSIDAGGGGRPAFGIQWDDVSKAYLTLTPACGDTFASRSAAVAVVTQRLKDRQIVTGWRDELYPITHSFYDEPVFAMERAAVPFLGALEYGVHINGLMQRDDGVLSMWMGRRSATKSKYPGVLDHIAAGGQPIGLSLTENVIKECFEEAGIPEEISRNGIRSAGVVSYERYAPMKDVVVRF